MAGSGGKGGSKGGGGASNAALAVDEPMRVFEQNRSRNFAEWKKKKRGPFPNSNMPPVRRVVDSK